MATYPNIERYRAELDELIEYSGSDNELTIKPAFRNCLTAYCREYRERLVLVDEAGCAGWDRAGWDSE